MNGTWKKSYTVRAATLLAALSSVSLSAFIPNNFFRPYDQAVRLPAIRGARFHVGALIEAGEGHEGRDSAGHKVNLLQARNASESTIMMLSQGLPNQRAAFEKALLNLNLLHPADDGTRGHVQFNGKYREFDATFMAGYALELGGLPGTLAINAMVPVIGKRVSGVGYTDLTNYDRSKFARADDLRMNAATQEFIKNLRDEVMALGGLDLTDWKKTGLGDVAIMLSWFNRFRQEKEFLKAVELFAQVGVTVPTAQERNEDRAFSMALGNDGAFGIPVGVGLNLEFINTLSGGVNVDFVGLFDHAKIRRLKTDRNQTDFLLLNKGDATKEHGLLWQFHLYLQSYHFLGGLSARAAYQFVKHDADRLVARDNNFSNDIINSAASLREWTAHNLIFSVNYDDAPVMNKQTGPVPQFQLFVKVPVAGKNVLNTTTFGGQFNVVF